MRTAYPRPMTAERRRVLLDYIAECLGSRRMWRVTILSALGLGCCLLLVGLLSAIYLDGAASLDDIGLPAVLTLALSPVVLAGFVYGVAGLRALGRHELLVALRADPPAIDRVDRTRDAYGLLLCFHVTNGGEHAIPMDEPTAAELIEWLSAGVLAP